MADEASKSEVWNKEYKEALNSATRYDYISSGTHRARFWWRFLGERKFWCEKISVNFFIIFICVIFGACGDVSNVDIHNETSKIFSQDDITAAEKVVLNEFKINWSGCTLKKLYYPGDDWADEFEHWRQFYNADRAIVLLSDYDVDVDSPTAKAGTTYSDWDWVLVRNNGEDWEFKTCGY